MRLANEMHARQHERDEGDEPARAAHDIVGAAPAPREDECTLDARGGPGELPRVQAERDERRAGICCLCAASVRRSGRGAGAYTDRRRWPWTGGQGAGAVQGDEGQRCAAQGARLGAHYPGRRADAPTATTPVRHLSFPARPSRPPGATSPLLVLIPRLCAAQ
jgi:hypothetical protein